MKGKKNIWSQIEGNWSRDSRTSLVSYRQLCTWSHTHVCVRNPARGHRHLFLHCPVPQSRISWRHLNGLQELHNAIKIWSLTLLRGFGTRCGGAIVDACPPSGLGSEYLTHCQELSGPGKPCSCRQIRRSWLRPSIYASLLKYRGPTLTAISPYGAS